MGKRRPQNPLEGNTLLTAKGRTGILTVDETFVTIERKGVMAKLTHGFTQGEKRIPIAQITSVQFKRPGMAVGYIQFSMGGSNEPTRGAFQAVKDENSVAFEADADKFEEIRDFVEAQIARRQNMASASDVPATSEPSFSERLRALASLRDDGLLTEEEFVSQKAKLLEQ